MNPEQTQNVISHARTVLTLFGTRPEVIKLAPVIKQLESARGRYRTVNVASGQHTSLLHPFVKLFDIRVDHDLRVMTPGQNPNGVCSRVLAALEPILDSERPDLLLVQGDTTTTLAGALAGFHRGIPVGHVEAGLRSGDRNSPFPEEMNRRLVTQLATLHFAATKRNRDVLLQEGVSRESVFLTGNPVVDALETILSGAPSNPAVDRVLAATSGYRRIVLTTHRRESFGRYMTTTLQVLRQFIDAHPDIALLFPVHPNPVVVETTNRVLGKHPRIHLLEPLSYEAFIVLLSRAWLIVSDSGGVQEEAPTLGKPLIILRENTERPEAVESGIARLLGDRPEHLTHLLEEAVRPHSWAEGIGKIANPFGSGDASSRIADVIGAHLFDTSSTLATVP
jgi:UDP-N-acetylglucosamine 2-epimerase (non-hydrolysing)